MTSYIIQDYILSKTHRIQTGGRCKQITRLKLDYWVRQRFSRYREVSFLAKKSHLGWNSGFLLGFGGGFKRKTLVLREIIGDWLVLREKKKSLY